MVIDPNFNHWYLIVIGEGERIIKGSSPRFLLLGRLGRVKPRAERASPRRRKSRGDSLRFPERSRRSFLSLLLRSVPRHGVVGSFTQLAPKVRFAHLVLIYFVWFVHRSDRTVLYYFHGLCYLFSLVLLV